MILDFGFWIWKEGGRFERYALMHARTTPAFGHPSFVRRGAFSCDPYATSPLSVLTNPNPKPKMK
jgi:hypothetical protein